MKHTLLIIEDDPDTSEMLRVYFEAQGYRVVTALTGKDGLDKCRSDPPNLVLLDVRLPDLDGFEVGQQLQDDVRTSRLPVIFVTERRGRDDKIMGLKLGAVDYITKPFDVQELRLRVRNALKRVSQGSLTNPVTGLPEGALVDEKLSEVLGKDGSSLLYIALENMDAFREAYGFVASDDVLRAVSLMVVNTMREFSRPEDFLGHISNTDFILVVPPSNLAALSDKLRSRLEQSMEYFYPIKDRDQMAKRPDRLHAKLFEMASLKNRQTDANTIKTELLAMKK